MAEPIVAYFSDVLNGISERFEAGPASTINQNLDPISDDYKPTTTKDIVITGPYGAESVRPGIGVTMHHVGGGLQQITLPFHARRYSRGDAERYAHDMLVRMGRTDLGELVVHNRAYTNCWFVGGDAEIIPAWENAGTDIATKVQRFHVRGSARFVRGIPNGALFENPATLPPPERGDAGGTNLGDYAASSGFVSAKVGRFCDLVGVQVDRPYVAAAIPRCDGMRIKGRNHTQPLLRTQLDYRRGRRVTLRFRGVVFAWQLNDGTIDPVPVTNPDVWNNQRSVVEQRIHSLEYTLRGEVLTLVGNGNTFFDCYLMEFSPDDDSERYTSLDFTASFQQNLNEVAAV